MTMLQSPDIVSVNVPQALREHFIRVSRGPQCEAQTHCLDALPSFVRVAIRFLTFHVYEQ